MAKGTDLENVFELVYLFDGHETNFNGDLNCGGDPHQDYTTLQCWMSAESIGRKARDFTLYKYNDQDPYRIAIRRGAALLRPDGLTETLEDTWQNERKKMGLKTNPKYDQSLKSEQQRRSKKTKESAKKTTKKATKSSNETQKSDLDDGQKYDVRDQYFKTFWDARTLGFFGGTGYDQPPTAKGPVVIHPAMSVHPVDIEYIANTREMLTQENDRKSRNRTIGQRAVMRYGLMQGIVTISPQSAAITGMSYRDLLVFLDALINCWTLDAGAYRRGVFRGIWLFKCPRYGRRPVGKDWSDVVEVSCKLDDPEDASKFSDFDITVHKEWIPKGVEMLDTEGVLALLDELDVPEAAE